jgi:hypothetical protein
MQGENSDSRNANPLVLGWFAFAGIFAVVIVAVVLTLRSLPVDPTGASGGLVQLIGLLLVLVVVFVIHIVLAGWLSIEAARQREGGSLLPQHIIACWLWMGLEAIAGGWLLLGLT